MKKWIALALALVLMLSMGVTAMADEVTSGNGSSTGNVNVTVVPFEDEVYAITIDWTSLTFEYEFTGWDTRDLVYTGDWVTKSANITVTNNSNVAITATPAAPVDQDANDGVTFSLQSAAAIDLDIGEYGTFTVVPGGAPKNNEAATFTAAKITVTIS